MKFGVVVFPGSNCEKDMADAVSLYLKEEVVFLWHHDADLKGVDAVLLPGGFSYGDYLRSGAIARFSPVMESVRAFADKGGPVLGVCNGFQVLTEAHLLPGALMRNQSLKFQCQQVQVVVETTRTVFSGAYQAGQTLQLPIAHADGNFFADPDVIRQLEDNQQVVLRYTQEVNGSVNRIAGICNEKGNVVGMMPHPERNLWPTSPTQGANWNGDGRGVFDSVLSLGLSLLKA
ncbi:phosphoribosylformylglycinamidine synthase subunit PurQ [Vampirovibrio sp.]|uniref:phosphoribosylformylglycinamidine synthase subunit PurQ n=1 Tax=Vampirovibrio sp. TaxID=2717857 RepID=UPI00359378B3